MLLLGHEHQEHPKPLKQYKHNRIAKPKSKRQYILMNQRRYRENRQLWQKLIPPENHLIAILIDISVQPIMHHDIPSPIVDREWRGIPPIFVEHAIPEFQDLGDGVHPGVEDPVEAAEED